jgi:thioredoxin reductase (NADPH)
MAAKQLPRVETPDQDGAFPRLTEGQLARLSAQGERRRTSEGDVLFREGDPSYDFYVMLQGKVATISNLGTDAEQVVAVHGPGRFLGELSLLTGQRALFSAVVVEAGEVLVVPVRRLRALVSHDAALGDLVLRAYMLRRELLIGLGAGLRIIGSRYSPDTRRLREFLARNRLPHRWIDLEDDTSAEQLLRELGIPPADTPVVMWHGEVLRNPSNAELARVVGLPDPTPSDGVADLVVVGAGPAGLAASVYGASEGLTTVALDAIATGGQAGTSSKIENYLGFPSGISGGELAERATMQARKFGAHIAVPAEAVGFTPCDGHYEIVLADGGTVKGRTVVIASGARYRKLQVPRLEEFEGNGVYYAATLTEAAVCGGEPVAVVGGGNSAGQATLFLSRVASRVQLIARRDSLEETMSRYLIDRIERTPNVEVLYHTVVCELHGEGWLDGVTVEDLASHERRRLGVRHLFVFIGADPHTAWLAGHVQLDDKGFVVTGPAAGGGLLLETNLPGVLAVGDVRSGSIKRVASAVGEGSMAVRLVHEHLADHQSAPAGTMAAMASAG